MTKIMMKPEVEPGISLHLMDSDEMVILGCDTIAFYVAQFSHSLATD